MKKALILIAALLSFSASADIRSRLEAIGAKFGPYNSVSGLRDLIDECGYNAPNQAKFARYLIKSGDSEKVECLENARPIVDARTSNEVGEESAARSIKSKIKSSKWSSLTDNEKSKVIEYILRNL